MTGPWASCGNCAMGQGAGRPLLSAFCRLAAISMCCDQLAICFFPSVLLRPLVCCKSPPVQFSPVHGGAQRSLVVVQVVSRVRGLKSCESQGIDANRAAMGLSNCGYRPAGMTVDVHKDASLIDGMKYFGKMEM